ncbi:MAG TPA: hypothetical protein VMB34_32555 [Acetobacteraceae bacterium]|nr:hypothetical protein [Acetobacteraceae bacterium]
MLPATRLYALVAVPLSLGIGLELMTFPVSGQSPPQQVTTDTPEYCLKLLDRVSALARDSLHPPQEAADLSTEGQRMCDQGQTRGGILRLRRALVLLRQTTGR